MLPRRAFLATAGLFAAASLAPRPARAGKPAPPPIPVLPLSFAVAERDGGPVCDAAWIDAQVADAAALFDPVGVPLRKVGARAIAARFAELETRDDRDALAEALEAHRINVMVVASLRDVDDPRRLRMGVHWRHRTTPARHWVVLAAYARTGVLAHELGHFFGLGHTSTPDNVMSYDRTGAAVFFDVAQQERIRAFARRYVASGEIRGAPPVPTLDSSNARVGSPPEGPR